MRKTDKNIEDDLRPEYDFVTMKIVARGSGRAEDLAYGKIVDARKTEETISLDDYLAGLKDRADRTE